MTTDWAVILYSFKLESDLLYRTLQFCYPIFYLSKTLKRDINKMNIVEFSEIAYILNNIKLYIDKKLGTFAWIIMR